MKKLLNLLTIMVLISGLFTLFFSGCSKTKDEVTTPNHTSSTVTDVDGNVYHTVKIGNQTWMVENLRVTKFNDGMSIDFVTGGKSASDWPTPHYCWYNNDSNNKSSYGALYNYRVVHSTIITDPQIAPVGWHVPTDDDWKILFNYLGGMSVAGGKMKSVGTIEEKTGLWLSPNTGATNECGFSAFPGGGCSNLNGFSSFNAGMIGNWWSSTHDQWGSYYYSLQFDNTAITSYTQGTFNSDFKSIRCIKN